LTTPTGGFVYDRRIVIGLRALGWQVETLDLGDGFPLPSSNVRASARARLAALPAGDKIVVDGLALGAMPDAAKQLRESHELIALVHHPLASETGLSSRDAARLHASEAEALACARRVIVTSEFTARLVISDYHVPADRVTVVRPGNDRAAPAHIASEGSVELLAVGAAVPRKGYAVLLAAVATLLDLQWRLTIVGDLERDPATTARLHADIARFRLADRVRLTGAIPADQLETLYASSDIFVLASRFEGYGMAFIEAIAHGLPVIGTTGGAIPEMLPAGAGLLTPPGDAAAFARAIRQLIENSAERSKLATAARMAAASLPTWEEAALLFSRAID
jgi:glycosyltransferase involved in cell wall biosynthesis